MKKLWFLMFTIFIFCGFEDMGAIRIDELQEVLLIGIDDDGDGVSVTFLTSYYEVEGGTVNNIVKAYNIKGESVFDATVKLNQLTNRNVYWGHMNQIIFGEDTAKNGIYDHIAFFEDSYEIKMTTNFSITKEISAEEYITTINEKQKEPVADFLEALYDNLGEVSELSEFTLLDYFKKSLNGKKDMVMPVIGFYENKSGSENNSGEGGDSKEEESSTTTEDSGGELSILLMGYGLFKEDVLQETIDTVPSRALTISMNKAVSGFVTLEELECMVRLNNIKSSIEPVIDDGELTVQIDVFFHSRVVEKHSYVILEKLIKEEIIAAENLIIQKQIENMVPLLKENKVDPLDIEELVRRKYPDFYEEVKNDWDDFLAKATYEVSVTSELRSGYSDHSIAK